MKMEKDKLAKKLEFKIDEIIREHEIACNKNKELVIQKESEIVELEDQIQFHCNEIIRLFKQGGR